MSMKPKSAISVTWILSKVPLLDTKEFTLKSSLSVKSVAMFSFGKMNSDAYGEALLAAIVHFNSNNLGFV